MKHKYTSWVEWRAKVDGTHSIITAVLYRFKWNGKTWRKCRVQSCFVQCTYKFKWIIEKTRVRQYSRSVSLETKLMFSSIGFMRFIAITEPLTHYFTLSLASADQISDIFFFWKKNPSLNIVLELLLKETCLLWTSRYVTSFMLYWTCPHVWVVAEVSPTFLIRVEFHATAAEPVGYLFCWHWLAEIRSQTQGTVKWNFFKRAAFDIIFEVSTPAIVTPCNLLNGYLYFGTNCCFYLQC